MPELAEWDSFYLIVGSAAGALIGLQFVVMTLIAARPVQAPPEVGAAFSTPTVIHFGVVFFLSAIIRAPWKTLTPTDISWAAAGVIGAVYAVIVARRMRNQNTYKPVFEDWLFHFILPFVSYAILAVSAITAYSNTRETLFAVGFSLLLLLFIGLHNAWDAVTYTVFTMPTQTEGSPPGMDQKTEIQRPPENGVEPKE